MTIKNENKSISTSMNHNTIVNVDMKSIQTISFVPNHKRRLEIYKYSILSHKNSSLCSKKKSFQQHHDVQQVEVDPSQSVLVNLAMQLDNTNTSDKVRMQCDTLITTHTVIKNSQFAMLPDRLAPLLLPSHYDDNDDYGMMTNNSGASSNGPNGVLIKFHTDYCGTLQNKRINLFDTNDKKTFELLDAYLIFRNGHKKQIFDMTVKQMTDTATSMNIQQGKDYHHAANFLSKIGRSKHFNSIVGICSFCQTWATSTTIGPPQFSIESPHFQTRFYIQNDQYWNDVFVNDENRATYIDSYIKVVQAHDKKMQELSYGGTDKKFVHLDELYKLLKRDINNELSTTPAWNLTKNQTVTTTQQQQHNEGEEIRINSINHSFQATSTTMNNPLPTFCKTKQKTIFCFWILGAPTLKAVTLAKETFDKHQNTSVMQIIICANLSSYQNAIASSTKNTASATSLLNNKETVNVHNLPTNFRTHYCPKQTIIMNETKVRDASSFKVSQKEVSLALAEIFNWANANNILIFFACPPRHLRPTYIIQEKETGKVKASFNPNYNDKITDDTATAHEQQQYENEKNLQLSQLLLNSLFTPVFGKDNLSRIMKETCHCNATYAADVLTVGCAILCDMDECWTSHTLSERACVLEDGIFEKQNMMTKCLFGIPYASAIFTKVLGDAKNTTNFRSFKDDPSSLVLMREKLISLLSSGDYGVDGGIMNEVLWETSIVFHDDRLNDIDDLPALHLIQALSAKTLMEKNYKLCNSLGSVL